MAQEFSFDVVSRVDLQEVSNAVQQASKEIATRFDFRGSASKIEWNEKELALTLISDDAHKLKSVVDILETRLVKRGIAVTVPRLTARSRTRRGAPSVRS